MSAAKKAPEPESQYCKDQIVCPYCLHEFSDSWEVCSGDSAEVQCPECEKLFEVNSDHAVSYTSSPLDPPFKETREEKAARELKKLGPPPMGFKNGEKAPIPRTGTLRISGTKISAKESASEKDLADAYEAGRKERSQVLQSALARLHKRGFALELDPHTMQHYPGIAHSHWIGRKGELEVKVSHGITEVEVEFFSVGERYGSERLEKMPAPRRLACLAEMVSVTRRLLDHGYKLSDEGGLQRAEVPLALRVRDAALGSYKGTMLEQYQHGQWSHMERDEQGFLAESVYLSQQNKALDRDGVRLHAGDERYFYYWSGHLMRGLVYPRINDNWFVWYGGGLHTSIQAHKLFSWTPGAPRRLKGKQSERVETELGKAVEARNWQRVQVLAGVLLRGGLTP